MNESRQPKAGLLRGLPESRRNGIQRAFAFQIQESRLPRCTKVDFLKEVEGEK
jgi:hypothetical protein